MNNLIHVLTLQLDCEPKAIQSVRSSVRGGFAHHYQPKANTDWKAYLKLAATESLPEGWELLDGGVAIACKFVFYPPKSMPKKMQERIRQGAEIFKVTKPDLPDNLKKGVCDALTGVVWRDDARICWERGAKKVYGFKPSIHFYVWKLPEGSYY